MALGDEPLGDSPLGTMGKLVTLKAGASKGKWAKAFAHDGSMVEYKITAAELAALQASPNGVPPGLTRQQWETGNYTIAGMDFDVGDAVENPDGSVVFKYDEQVVSGKIVESAMKLLPGEWTGTFPAITVSPTKILETDQTRVSSKVLAVTDGVIDVESPIVVAG